MRPISGASRRHVRKVAASAALVLALPLAALAAPAADAGGSSAPGAPASATPTTSSSSCPWLSKSLPVSQRVQMLMAQMTLADKINEVTGAGTSEPYVFYIAAVPSLCIPAIGEEDGPLGPGDGLTGVTQLPSAVSVAATFDPSLAAQYGQVVGSEEHGKGAMVDLGRRSTLIVTRAGAGRSRPTRRTRT
jgi:hypothetical protein